MQPVRLADIRSFVREVAIPNEDRVEADDCIPEEIVQEMRKRGYFGWSIPEEFGGAGLTTEELALANLEMYQRNASLLDRDVTLVDLRVPGVVALKPGPLAAEQIAEANKAGKKKKPAAKIDPEYETPAEKRADGAQ